MCVSCSLSEDHVSERTRVHAVREAPEDTKMVIDSHSSVAHRGVCLGTVGTIGKTSFRGRTMVWKTLHHLRRVLLFRSHCMAHGQ